MPFITITSVVYISVDFLILLDYGAVRSAKSSLLSHNFSANREINKLKILSNREVKELFLLI